jgi:hypothetical protein
VKHFHAPVTSEEAALPGGIPANSLGEPMSVRIAVLDLLAYAAPRPAALGAPSEEEQEFLDTLRRIVRRSAVEELRDKYNGSRHDPRARAFAIFED